jgi:hypothetical protein
MPRSPMVPVRSDLHGSLAAARPQLRKLCALLGAEESSRLFASPVLRASTANAEAVLACFLGRLADAFGSVLGSSDAPLVVSAAGVRSRPRKVRRGRCNRASRQQQQALTAQQQPAPVCGGSVVTPQPGVPSFRKAGWCP